LHDSLINFLPGIVVEAGTVHRHGPAGDPDVMGIAADTDAKDRSGEGIKTAAPGFFPGSNLVAESA
jgi:hypothetical protein